MTKVYQNGYAIPVALPPLPPPRLPDLHTVAKAAEEVVRAQVVALGEILPSIASVALPTPPRVEVATQAPTGAAGDNWFFVGNSNDYPGDHPDFGTLRQLGMTGVALEVSDEALVIGASADRGAGFKVGIWGDFGNYGNVAAYIAALKAAADLVGADAILLDVETQAKGALDSPAYQLSAAIAQAAKAAFPTTEIGVVPIRSGADFDFHAYADLGMDVIVQTYGANPLTDLFDPVEVVRLVMAQGIPISKIGVLISPAQLATAPAALRAIGVRSISVYRSQGLTPEVIANAAPFLAAIPISEPAPEGVPAQTTEEAPRPATFPQDDPPDDLGDTWQSFAAANPDPDTRSLADSSGLASSRKLAGRSFPPGLLKAIDDDLGASDFPENIKWGLRAAVLVWQKGIPYVWGGTNPNKGLDCSGFAQFVLRTAGDASIARVTYDQAKQGHLVSAGHRQPLDLCFFEPQRQGPGHVAVYIANGWVIHEPHTGTIAQWLNVETGWVPMETRRYFPDIVRGKPMGKKPAPKGNSVSTHYVPVGVHENWKQLVNVFRLGVPTAHSNVEAIGNEIRKVFG